MLKRLESGEWEGARRWSSSTVLYAAAVLLFLIGGACSVTTVRTGHVGVLTLFGKVTGEPIAEGINVINPFKSVTEISIRTQEIKETADVPSSEGLIVTLETSLLFRLKRENAAQVFQTIGPNYMDVIVEPNLRSAIRSVTAAHSANALYSSAREEVARQISDELSKQLAPRGIVVENVLLRDIKLPPTLKASIEAKQQAEQEALAMSFRLQKETQEAERKRIEAAGVRDFQQIVATGITNQLIEWKWIEAYEKLASSPNAKIVVPMGGRAMQMLLSADR